MVIKLPKDREQQSEQTDITSDEVYIGHMAGCQIHLEDQTICPVHARIFHEASGYYIEDLRSINGTMLNGMPIEKQMELKDGDIIGIGEENLAFCVEKIHTPETVFLFSRKARGMKNTKEVEALKVKKIEEEIGKATRKFTLGPRPAIPVSTLEAGDESATIEQKPIPLHQAMNTRATHHMNRTAPHPPANGNLPNSLTHNINGVQKNIEQTVQKISTSIYRSIHYKRYLRYLYRTKSVHSSQNDIITFEETKTIVLSIIITAFVLISGITLWLIFG